MQIIDWLFGLVIIALASLTGCGAAGYEQYCGYRRVDTIAVQNTTQNNTTGGLLHGVFGGWGGNDKATLSGE